MNKFIKQLVDISVQKNYAFPIPLLSADDVGVECACG